MHDKLRSHVESWNRRKTRSNMQRPKKTKNIVAETETIRSMHGDSLVDWSLFAVYTDSGVLLAPLTLDRALMDLDQWAWLQRTGMEVTHMARGERLNIVSWKSVLGALNMSLDGLDRKKLYSALDKDLDGYAKRIAERATRSASVPSISAEDAKQMAADVHKVFAHRKTNEMGIEALAVYVQIETDSKDDLDEIKNKIRAVARLMPKTFSTGGSPASPRVRRLLDSKGKTTGIDAFPPRKTRGPSRSNGTE